VDVASEDVLGGSGALGDTDEAGMYTLYTGRNEGIQLSKSSVKITKVESILVDKETDTYKDNILVPEV